MHRFRARTITPLQRLGMWLVGVFFVTAFAAANIGFDRTLSQFSSTPESAPTNGAVDQRTYLTARNLAALAATPPEQQYAVQAMRAADHELDQDFATAIRESAGLRLRSTPQTAALLQREVELKQTLRSDETRVAAAKPVDSAGISEAGEQELRLAEAQLTLDQDELDNVDEELTRVGGNKQAQIQQAFDQHRSIESQAAALPKNTATAELETPQALQSVVGKFRILSSLKERRSLIERARQAVLGTLQTLQTERGAAAKPLTQTQGTTRAAKLADIQAQASQQRTLSELDRRLHDLQQVAAVYGSWSQLTRVQAHLLHIALEEDAIVIVMAFLGIFMLSGFAQWLIRRWETKHHHRLNHARVVITLVLEIIVVARVAVVIFGMPGNVSTIIGFITAGITVTMRDFLVSLVGWFVLMGKRGIQVGDWVEVDGTQGEVVEITALHTYLLEAGNWATSGQFTGRQAVFMNKYAVERKYFNYTTHEQWMWDELVIPAPASKPITPEILQTVQTAVKDETSQAVAEAEASWRDIAVTHGLRVRRETPAVVVRTSASGLEVVVRFVTKAPTRFETAVHLRQVVLEKLRLGTYSA